MLWHKLAVKIKMSNNINTTDLPFWGEVEKRFANVKSVPEYNKIRQDLIDERCTEYENKTYKIALTKKEEIVLPYFIFLCYKLDSSGLIARVLGIKVKPVSNENSTVNSK